MRKKLIVFALCSVLIACAARKPVVGSANQFDSDTYVTLATTDTLIQATKQQLIANAFPADVAQRVKVALNDLIQAYDVADTAWLAYHTAALAGTATQAQVNHVTATMNNVNVATGQLVTVKGGA